MTLYVDIIFIENLIMNYVILLSTGIINKEKNNKIMLIISSIIGGIYSIIECIFKIEIYSNQILKLILSVSMIYVAFKANNIKKFIKQLIIFYLTSFTFGGCAFFLLYYIKPEQIITDSGKYILKIVVLGAILGFFILHTALRIIRSKVDKKVTIKLIKIFYNNKSHIVKAMLDTGNLLCDPITKVPVVIVEKNELKNIIPQQLLNINENQMISFNFNYLDEQIQTRLKIIPFKSIGNENGILIGFKPDYLEIEFEDEIKSIKDVIIGLYENKLSKSDKYSAIFGLNIINQEERQVNCK